MTIKEKLRQLEDEYSWRIAFTPSSGIKVSDRIIANNVPVLVQCLRIALQDMSRLTRREIAEKLGVEAALLETDSDVAHTGQEAADTEESP